LWILYEYNNVKWPQVRVDRAKAREWYEKAAAGGDAPSMRHPAYLCNFGEDTPQDHEKAREWYEKAAAAFAPDSVP
jgi:TPR repeat protein